MIDVVFELGKRRIHAADLEEELEASSMRARAERIRAGIQAVLCPRHGRPQGQLAVSLDTTPPGALLTNACCSALEPVVDEALARVVP